MRPERGDLSDAERSAIEAVAEAEPAAVLAIFFNARDFSATGGLCGSTMRELGGWGGGRQVELVGLEAVTSLLLAATLVYLDVAPELEWRYVNYHF